MNAKKIFGVRSQSPIFHLNGGIGNQLFVYAAGKAFSKSNNTPVKFDLSDVGKGFTNHGSSIQALALDLDVAPSKSHFQRLAKRVFNKFHRAFYKLTSRKLISISSYQSYEIGYDSALFKKQFARNIRGYYQSWKYVEAVYEIFPRREAILKSPSKWFYDLRELALVECPIILHVRRGDYKKLSNTYGLLSSDYYKTAVERVRVFLPENPIWVISDDIDEAKVLLSSVLPIDTIWVDPPLGTDPVESLVLMCFGSANIIGNSTFSWWGAMLNRNSVVTVAPQKWFKNLIDPKDLYPPNWLQVPSSWES
jgi:hypothetical protein